jgi:hypothetical protein
MSLARVNPPVDPGKILTVGTYLFSGYTDIFSAPETRSL